MAAVCLQIKDEQGNFKSENFSELRHVAFNIRDPDGDVDGEKPATSNPARSGSLLHAATAMSDLVSHAILQT